MSLPWYKRLIFYGVPAVAAAATPVVVPEAFRFFFGGGDPRLKIKNVRVASIPAPSMTESPVVKWWVPDWGVPLIFHPEQPKHLNKIIVLVHKESEISVKNCSIKLVEAMLVTESMVASKDIAKNISDVEFMFTVPVGGVENGHLKEGGNLELYVACDGANSDFFVATLR